MNRVAHHICGGEAGVARVGERTLAADGQGVAFAGFDCQAGCAV